jgi:cobalt-zinc-cadmium resistance protein CzcA
LEDWLLEKSFKGVKGVVDVSSFGGPTKEYQIKLERCPGVDQPSCVPC